MRALPILVANFISLLILCSSQTYDDMLAASTADGLELFAMAKAIPRLQNLDGTSFKMCIHLHYITCHQADAMDLSSQQTSLPEIRPRGLQTAHLLTQI